MAEYKLWHRRPEWPYDAPGHIYMMRAAEQIGSILGADWKGIADQAARHEALEKIREHCAHGRLTAAAMIQDGTFRELPVARWNTADCWTWFPTCTISNFALFAHQIHPLAGVSQFPLYVTSKSLGRQLAKMQLPQSEKTKARNYSLKSVMEWAQPIFDEAEAGGKYNHTQASFEEAANHRFPGIGIEWLRKNIWAKRPPVYPRRAPRGA